jgi:two-component system, LytTR family, response regulator
MKRLKALIIDDVRLIRTELKMILHDFQEIEVIGEAGNYSDTLKLIREEKPDVLFLDIHLPGRSGFELLDAIDMDLKVIFISSYFHKYSTKAQEYDPVGLLSKPINKKKLCMTIKKLVKNRDNN